MISIKYIIQTLHEISGLERIDVSLGGGDVSKKLYSVFTKPHPRYRVFGAKTIGVALLPIPKEIRLCIKGKHRQVFRTNMNHARKSGYSLIKFHGQDYYEDVLSINCSSEERQGRKIPHEYLDEDIVYKYCESRRDLIGVIAPTGRLVAYLDLLVCGEIALASRLLGHNEHLREGVMYLLLYGGIENCINMNEHGHSICWLMYDTFFGASSGLRYFKERVGFIPYRVNWTMNP